MLRAWRLGRLKLADEDEARGRVLALQEIDELTLESIRQFYGIVPEDQAGG